MDSVDTAMSEALAPSTVKRAKPFELLRHSLSRFLVAGGLSTGIDIGLLYCLHGVLHVQLSVATFIAVLVSFTVNFTLNRAWSFGSAAPVGGQMVRYLVLAGFNWVATVVLVSWLSALGLNYLIAKVLTVAVNSAVNYVLYQRWVFKES
ncbi:GtrA family protein [Kitasatospora sp. LaBMicrA B282]|uniref:GtrA family protein n=1 Tax=Kitasatospora sp. LaBMicrA B282 TaxID=3420949 RepID=UPI003D12B427